MLAEIHSIAKGEYKRLEYYRSIATPLAHRLELHQSQKRCSLGALACETGKKVFWTLYTLDWYVTSGERNVSPLADNISFSAAMLGLPTTLAEAEIHTEYPADVDDENISDKGFQPILPGEFTRLSSALALFRVSRIMSKVLSVVYPVASSHDVSLQKLDGLDNELDEWLKSLPTHLRLRFAQDKPSTNVCGSRSPILVSNICSYTRPLLTYVVPGVSLYPHSYPPASGRTQSWSQSRSFHCRPSSVQQAYHSNRTALRRAQNELFNLSQQGQCFTACRLWLAVPDIGTGSQRETNPGKSAPPLLRYIDLGTQRGCWSLAIQESDMCYDQY